MTRLHDRAHKVHEAIRRGEGLKALFYLPKPPSVGGWHWQAFGVDSDRGQKMLSKFPQYWVGNFLPNVGFDHLIELMADEEKKPGETS